MTQMEFEREYKRLVEHFKFGFEKSAIKEALARKVAPLESRWWKRIVDDVILSNDRDFDFAEVIRAERHRVAMIRLGDKEKFRQPDILKEKMTDEGFEKALDLYEADNVWDAVQKSREANVKKGI